MKKKLTIAFLCMLSLNSYSQPNIFGEANLFEYDDAGSRVKRTYNNNTVINLRKTRGNTEKLDTVVTNTANINIVVYPNPVQENIIVESKVSKLHSETHVKVFDMIGREIRIFAIRTNKEIIRLGDLIPGIYHLNYYQGKNIIATWKVVKN